MNNHLPNGTVLPFGLLGIDKEATMAAFNRAYKNTSLRLGIVKNAYATSDPNNYSKLSTEYDVTVLEQTENNSCTNLTYRNCISSEGMGSLADFFEKNLRTQTQNNNPNNLTNTANQNGAIVLILCLDSFTNKAIIISGMTHPDRTTKLVSTAPQLYGEYNGVAVAVNPDGSTSLTFNGATDNNGDVTNPSQGTTTWQIETDGSYQFTNSAVDIQADKNGTLNITCTGPANIIAQGTTTVDGSTIKLGVNAVQSVIRGNDFAEIFDTHTHFGNLGAETSVPLQKAEPSLSTHVFTE